MPGMLASIRKCRNRTKSPHICCISEFLSPFVSTGYFLYQILPNKAGLREAMRFLERRETDIHHHAFSSSVHPFCLKLCCPRSPRCFVPCFSHSLILLLTAVHLAPARQRSLFKPLLPSSLERTHMSYSCSLFKYFLGISHFSLRKTNMKSPLLTNSYMYCSVLWIRHTLVNSRC